MTTIDTITDERQKLVLKTISSAYEAESDNERSNLDGNFAVRVATAVVKAGITRSGDAQTDQIDVVYLIVDAHKDWFAGAYQAESDNYAIGDFFAGALVHNDFYLDESKAR